MHNLRVDHVKSASFIFKPLELAVARSSAAPAQAARSVRAKARVYCLLRGEKSSSTAAELEHIC